MYITSIDVHLTLLNYSFKIDEIELTTPTSHITPITVYKSIHNEYIGIKSTQIVSVTCSNSLLMWCVK